MDLELSRIIAAVVFGAQHLTAGNNEIKLVRWISPHFADVYKEGR